ncbi:MAG: hypothetical protein JW715_09950 [Sedimentisphaerales bacterium]|nr:hypothetical protein [Sedimentisphaerales bacterium]
MVEENKRKIWKVRTIKNYPQAHNHLFIGNVLNIENSFVRMKCRTYHFGRSMNSLKDIKVGNVGIRIIPWSRIEIINELAATFDYRQAKLSLESGNVVLSDEKSSYVIASSYDSRY